MSVSHAVRPVCSYRSIHKGGAPIYLRVTPLAYDPAQEAAVLQIIDQQLLPIIRQFSV